MLEAIRGAKDTINFEVYIFESDDTGREFIEAFTERARAGVEVRLLLDWFGSFRLKRARPPRAARARACKLEFFRPLALRNLVRIYRRTHRRAIVIDGRVGFTGGAAVSDKWRGDTRNPKEWRDSMTRVTGALVAGVQSAFAANWVYCCGEVHRRARDSTRRAEDAGPACGALGGELTLGRAAADPAALLAQLRQRAAPALDRELLLHSRPRSCGRRCRSAPAPGWTFGSWCPATTPTRIPVQYAGRGYYEELLEAGVRIFEYQASMMHAKTVVVDDGWTLVGSANMDERSMELNEENLLGIARAGLRAGGRPRGSSRTSRRPRRSSSRPGAGGRCTSACWRRSARMLIEQY